MLNGTSGGQYTPRLSQTSWGRPLPHSLPNVPEFYLQLVDQQGNPMRQNDRAPSKSNVLVDHVHGDGRPGTANDTLQKILYKTLLLSNGLQKFVHDSHQHTDFHAERELMHRRYGQRSYGLHNEEGVPLSRLSPSYEFHPSGVRRALLIGICYDSQELPCRYCRGLPWTYCSQAKPLNGPQNDLWKVYKILRQEISFYSKLSGTALAKQISKPKSPREP